LRFGGIPAAYASEVARGTLGKRAEAEALVLLGTLAATAAAKKSASTRPT
jgi:hypothetical protein